MLNDNVISFYINLKNKSYRLRFNLTFSFHIYYSISKDYKCCDHIQNKLHKVAFGLYET